MQIADSRSVSQSIQEYGRGVAGGLMFSLPLLFTMEVWWAGFTVHPTRLLGYVLATFALLLAYNRFAGLREDASFVECAIDSVEELGIGLVLSACVLWLLGQVTPEMSFLEISGKIVMEGMTVAIGVSVGTAQLGSREDDENSGLAGDRPSSFLSQMAIAACGAVLFAANVAPTEEILVIAIQNPPWKLLLFALCSLIVGSYILFFAEFRGSGRYVHRANGWEVARGVMTTYAIALICSAGALHFFGRFDGEAFHICVAQTIVLGMAASLGASGGRLLLQYEQ